ncbi:MAG: hypothetical protein WB439_13895 [Acidobacteriaceae bacterium]
MIDIQPPEHTPHTWRDFFIHIATIVLGLVIAIGLEQSVEAIHHRHQLAEARKELRGEVAENIQITSEDLDKIHQLQAELNHDMALLLAHRDTGKPLAGKLDFTWYFYVTRDAAWKTNQQTGALNLMPHPELEHYAFTFGVCEGVVESAERWNIEISIAKAIANRYPTGQLSPQDTAELITAISDTQGKLAWTATLIGFARSGLNDHGFEH